MTRRGKENTPGSRHEDDGRLRMWKPGGHGPVHGPRERAAGRGRPVRASEGRRPCHQGGRRSDRWGTERKGRGGTFPLHLSPFMPDFRLDLGNYLLLSIISFPHSRRGKNTPEFLWGKETPAVQLFSAQGAGALQSRSGCRPLSSPRLPPHAGLSGSQASGPSATLVPDTGRQVGGSQDRFLPRQRQRRHPGARAVRGHGGLCSPCVRPTGLRTPPLCQRSGN